MCLLKQQTSFRVFLWCHSGVTAPAVSGQRHGRGSGPVAAGEMLFQKREQGRKAIGKKKRRPLRVGVMMAASVQGRNVEVLCSDAVH